jgi:hypothetical protein
MTYTVDYFIEKFKAIPKKEWCTQVFVNRKGQKCAFGHCGSTVDNASSLESDALENLIDTNLSIVSVVNTVSAINDGRDFRFQQKTPKLRILAALRWIKGREK